MLILSPFGAYPAMKEATTQKNQACVHRNRWYGHVHCEAQVDQLNVFLHFYNCENLLHAIDL